MILAIETATPICGAALIENQKIVASRSINEKNVHSEKLLVFIDELFHEAKTTLQKIDAIAISIGPGSFTGLRIGLSIAKGLGYAQSKPIITVPTLDSLVMEYLRTNPSQRNTIICPLIDARRDEAYFSFFEINNNIPHNLTPYSIAPIQEIITLAKQYDNVIFIGDGAIKIASHNYTINSNIICNPIAIGMLAEHYWQKKKNILYEYDFLEPLYIREFYTTAKIQ